MNFLNLAFFLLSSIMLLGSPGPAIAALVAIAKYRGFRGSLPFFCGLQFGLAAAAAAVAMGLFSLVVMLPLATTILTFAAVAYLIWLAVKIATAPVGHEASVQDREIPATLLAGVLLGISNPKAYLAFLSLIASYAILPSDPWLDSTLKWALLVGVMITVDLAWLWIGTMIGKIALAPRTERVLNWLMGGAVALSAAMAVL